MATYNISHANVYLDGRSLLGTVSEFKNPEISFKTTDFMPLGQIGTVSRTSGIEKMEGELKWTSFSGSVYATAAPFGTHRLQIRANVDDYDASGALTQRALVVYLTVNFTSVPNGEFKAHENAEYTSKYTASSIRVEYNGVVQLEYDAAANVYRVNGIDQLAQLNANIGL